MLRMNLTHVSVFDKCDGDKKDNVCVGKINIKDTHSGFEATEHPNYIITAHGAAKYKKKGTIIPKGIMLVLYASPGTPIEILAGRPLGDYLTTRRDEKTPNWESFKFDANNPYHPNILTIIDASMKATQLDIDITLGADSKFHDPPTIQKGALLRPPNLDRHQSAPPPWLERSGAPRLHKSRSYAPWSQYLPPPTLPEPSVDELFPHWRSGLGDECTTNEPEKCAQISALCSPVPNIDKRIMETPCKCENGRCYYTGSDYYPSLASHPNVNFLEEKVSEDELNETAVTGKFTAKIENITFVNHPELVEEIKEKMSLTEALKKIMDNVSSHKQEFAIYDETPIKVHLIACLSMYCGKDKKCDDNINQFCSCPKGFECRPTECKDYRTQKMCKLSPPNMCSWEKDKCTFDKKMIISKLKNRCNYDNDVKWDDLSPADLEDVWNDTIYTKNYGCMGSDKVGMYVDADLFRAELDLDDATKKYRPKIDYARYLKDKTKQRRNTYRCYPKRY